MDSVIGHGLHGTPWAQGPGGHLRRAAGFMLFTELEPSVLCPVSMSYAVTPALKANAALHAIATLATTDDALAVALEAFRAKQTEAARAMTLPL